MVIVTDTADIEPRPRRWAGLEAAAEYIGISKETLRRDLRHGKLKKYWYGAFIIVDLDEVDALILSSITEG